MLILTSRHLHRLHVLVTHDGQRQFRAITASAALCGRARLCPLVQLGAAAAIGPQPPTTSMVQLCGRCNAQKAALRRPKTVEQVLIACHLGLSYEQIVLAAMSTSSLTDTPSNTLSQQRSLLLQLCRECFYEVFEQEVHETIVSNKLFKAGDKVAIGASGICAVPQQNVLLKTLQ